MANDGRAPGGTPGAAAGGGNETRRSRYDHTTSLDRVVAAAARQLRPGVLTEEQWLRQHHLDIPAMPTWQLRRELRIVTAYLDTPLARRSWDLLWWRERRERLLGELRRRRGGDRPDPVPTPARPARPARPTSAAVRLSWRGGAA